jgi:hypothetical protein
MMTYSNVALCKYERNNAKEGVNFDGLRFGVEIDLGFDSSASLYDQFHRLKSVFLRGFAGAGRGAQKHKTADVAPEQITRPPGKRNTVRDSLFCLALTKTSCKLSEAQQRTF